jgi:long-chain acyl-CoA synthetase
VSFFPSKTGQLQGAHLSHTNFTAGVAAIRALLPHSNGISSLDTIISAHPLSTPFGRAIAYTAIFEGSSFATLNSTELFHVENSAIPEHDVNDILSATQHTIPSPTILFIRPAHLQSLSSSITTEAQQSSFLYSFASRHKLSGMTDGFITKDSLWDRIIFDGARSVVLGDSANTIRGVIVSGGMSQRSN